MPTRPRSCNRKTTSGCSAMIRKLGLVGAIAGVVLVTQAGSPYAQVQLSVEGLEDLRHCELWNPVPGDKPGTPRQLFVVQFLRSAGMPSAHKVPGQYASEEGFVIIPFNLPLAYWSEP